MSLELIDRLVEWLAFFLSQNDFGWDWDSWSFVADQPDFMIQKVFVKTLLTKCSNLTDVKAISQNLPDQLKHMVNVERLGQFKYINESKDNYDAQTILDQMSSREKVFSKGAFEVESSGDQFTEIFVECFLYKTQKSIRHIKILSDKFLIFMKEAFSEETAQVKALETIIRVWETDEYKTVNIIDQFLNLGIVTSQTLIK
jgi:hypothetical protein